jgi:hypothetical protein
MEKLEKIIKIVLITGMHNKPQACGVSVASGVGPFTTTKTIQHASDITNM